MSPFSKMSSRKTISVIIFTKYHLISESLKLLLESKSEIRVRDFAFTIGELFQKVTQQKPDVVLFYLMEEEFESIEILPKIFELSSSTKVLILSTLNKALDQTKILKLGATGIVGTDQKEEVLIRAIRRVSEGEVWFSQKLIAQLLGDENNANHNSHQNGMPKNQSLTAREFDVVELIAEGLNNKEISKKLFISEATVRHHLSSIYSKLYVGDRLNLVIYAYQNNIVRRISDQNYV